MTYELTEIDEEAIVEPITLAELKSYMRIDQDYLSDDGDLMTTLSAARVRLEQYLNIGLANREVRLQWYGGLIELPLSPINDIVSVTDSEGVVLPADDYKSVGFNNEKLYVISVCTLNGDFFYNITDMVLEVERSLDHTSKAVYTAVYDCGHTILPKLLKQAILSECDYLFKLRGMPVTDIVSPNAALLASGYSKNLIL